MRALSLVVDLRFDPGYIARAFFVSPNVSERKGKKRRKMLERTEGVLGNGTKIENEGEAVLIEVGHEREEAIAKTGGGWQTRL